MARPGHEAALTSPPPVKVVHVINGLGVGGAEMTLLKLLSRLDRRAFPTEVVSLTERGPLASELEALGCRVHSLDLRSASGVPAAILRLRRVMRSARPDVVQTWMHHSDLIGGLAAILARTGRVVWSLRAGDLVAENNRWHTVVVGRAGLVSSRWIPARIVCGSHAARDAYAAMGYPDRKLEVIVNGFDLPSPDPGARGSLREELRLPDDAVLVGRVARFHPYKGYPVLLEAAAAVLRSHPSVHFVLVGAGVTNENSELMSLIGSYGIERNCHLLGERSDVTRLHAAFDVECSASVGEGFPNVIAEAMAAGTPVVATAVGDSGRILGHTGGLVAPRDPAALAEGIVELLKLSRRERAQRGEVARGRIREMYGLDAMAARYAALFTDVSGPPR